MKNTINTEVETQEFALADLRAAEYNPRAISAAALQGLSESLGDLGILDIPVVNIYEGRQTIVGGHQRVSVLSQAGYTHARCIVVRFDVMAEKAANLTLNNPAIRGTWDALAAVPILDVVMPTLAAPEHMLLSVLNADLVRQAKLLEAGLTPATAATETPVKPKSKKGMLYAIGDHLLLCGSFSKLGKVFGDEAASACITDPPYNVAYVSSSGDSIENDAQTPEEWVKFLASFTHEILDWTDGPCYLFMASKELPALAAAWEKSEGVILNWGYWVKSTFTLGRGDYHHQHEPFLFGARAGLSPKSKHTILEFPKPSVNALHPTQKPVELIAALVEEATEPGDIIAEPFCGSGTTMACSQAAGRICYASELDPRFVDVTRKRVAEQIHGVGCDWEKLTPGKKL